MRRSRQEAAETRHRIVEAASRLFRGKGIAATSIADIMSSVGLTVGGFYRHFDSKEALVAEAIEAASLETTRGHEEHAQRFDAKERAPALLDRYLSDLHRAHPDHGCPVAALCSEIGHEGRPTKEAFTKALRRLIAIVDGVVAKEGKQRRRETLYAAAATVGALVLARATSDEDLAHELLAAARAGVAKLAARPT
jgi:TetR/AcrR family transcriptional regulator, transcriptional repressor for nem operon